MRIDESSVDHMALWNLSRWQRTVAVALGNLRPILWGMAHKGRTMGGD